MNDTQTLELQLKTTGEQALKVLEKLNITLSGLNNNLSKTQSAANNIDNIGKNAEKAKTKMDGLSKSLSSLFTFVGVKKIGLKIMESLDAATNRAEELNLFNVVFKNIKKNGEETFSSLGKEAIRFQNRLKEAFGTNMTETLRYQGLFQAMGTNAGINEKYAYIMAENMTKLTYDLASLYNKSESTVAEALRAGVYAGMTKPMRSLGVDVTQTTLKPLLKSLGITDRTISEMSQAEKEILRYIATLNQAKVAMGDFANTIESPANQLRIFKNQLTEVKNAWGSLFMGMYANILPYANAILMILTELAKAIANFFGIKTQDFNTGMADLEGISDGFDDIGVGAGNAAKAAKELKRQVLGFDQINNLSTPSASGGGASAGGIDSRLLEALQSYDNLMGEVKTKATAIRDSVMEWLGFTRMTDEETGEVYFKFKKITAGTVLGALGVGGIIYKGIKFVLDVFSKITGLKFLNISSVFGKEGILTSGISKLLSFINPITLAVAGLTAGLVILYDKSENFREKVNSFFSLLKRDFKPFIDGFLNTVNKLFNSISSVLSDIYANILVPLGNLFLSVLEPVASAILDILTQLWISVIEPLSPVLKWLVDSAIAGVKIALDAVIDVISDIIDIVQTVWDVVKPVVKLITDAILGIIKTIGDVIGWVKDALKWLGLLKDEEKKVSVGGGGKGAFGGGGSSYGGRALGGIFNGSTWKNLPQYANGGLPSHGTIFAAGENGAEIVGNINRRTEVLNRSQIASAIYSAVASAMSQYGGGTTQVELYAHTDEGVVIDKINQKTKQTGVCPINIPIQNVSMPQVPAMGVAALR